MKCLVVFLVIAFSVPAQTVTAPLAGTMVDGHGRIVKLYGVLGNLLPPQYPVMPLELQGQALLSAAFSASGGAIKTASQLVLMDGTGAVTSVQPAPQGASLFSFSTNGTPAWVFYAYESELVNIASGTSLDTSGFGDSVVALGPIGESSARLLSSRGSELRSVSVSIPGGVFLEQTTVSGLPPAAFFQNGWLTTSPTGLFWTALGATTATRQITLPEALHSLQMAAAGAVVINGEWLLNAGFQLLEIPRTPLPSRQSNLGHPPAGVR
jgi:hypothetical protein